MPNNVDAGAHNNLFQVCELAWTLLDEIGEAGGRMSTRSGRHRQHFSVPAVSCEVVITKELGASESERDVISVPRQRPHK